MKTKDNRKSRLKKKLRRQSERILRMIDQKLGYSRSCVGCQECCEFQAVKELGKPGGERCRHQCNAGCAIYDRRPGSCKEYLCGWRAGLVGGERPDRQGFIVDKNTASTVIHVIETRPGACEEGHGQRA